MSDLIDREDAIRAVGEAWGKAYRVIDALKSIPSAERKGEWIYTNDPLRLDDEWACSRCGNISFVRTNFCDRCGARMKGAEDEVL